MTRQQRQADKPGHSTRAGFLLMFVLFVISIPLMLIASSLGRSMTDLSAANRIAAMTRVLHTADGGVDEGLTFFQKSYASDVHALLADLPRVLPCTLPGCALRVEDDDEADADVTNDTNRVIQIISGSVQGGAAQEVAALVQLDLSGPTVYPYAVAGTTVNMDGNATFGDPLYADQTVIYVQGPMDPSGAYITSGNNDVWASKIAFHNPDSLPLATLCPNCTDYSTFHGPPEYATNAPLQPPLQLDLKPYYDQAVALGQVISADTTFNGVTLSGVYYVECGVNILFKNTVTLQGTIVHEGCGGDMTLAEQSSLTIDSAGGSQFAPGMAILGVPDLDFGRNVGIDIRGIVMGSGERSSIMSKTGLIRGSLLAVGDAWVGHPDLVSGPGPGQDSQLTFPLARLHISEATVLFSHVLDGTPGTVASGVTTDMLMWTVR